MDLKIKEAAEHFPNFSVWQLQHSIRVDSHSRVEYFFRNMYAQARCMYIYSLFEKEFKEFEDAEHPTFAWYPVVEHKTNAITMTTNSLYKVNAFPFPESTLLTEFIKLCGADLFKYFYAVCETY